MKLIAGGDSFIYGSELADCPNGKTYSQKTFTALLSKEYNLEYQCSAYPGNSNNSISRSVINTVELCKSNKVVVVCWTFPQRWEFRLFNDQGKDQWFNVNSWHTDKKYRFNSLDFDESMIRKFATEYFKTAGASEYYEVYSTLKEILFLQYYLKNNNIPYLFTTANNTFFEHENYSRNVSNELLTLTNEIDWDEWYFFPEGSGPSQTEAPRGFYQWAIENKYSIGPKSHPLEQAHQDAFKLIKEKFNEVVKKNN